MVEKETVLCEKCGTEMRSIHELCTVGMKCAACGWGWVTTNPMISDTKTYNIFLYPIKSTADNIKIISSIANCNYITAKKLIESAPVSVFSGSALEVKLIKERLENADIIHSIEPEFPY